MRDKNLPDGPTLLTLTPTRANEKFGVDEGARTPDLQDHNLAL